ncbi:MAG: hypothetical protein CMP24_05325 [Rickettsiales bacterium]|nr:hypothetical protein [Rickettsiales bacterium]
MIKIIKFIELLILGIVFPSSIVFFNLSEYILIFLWIVFFYATMIYLLVYKKKIEIRKFLKVNFNKNKDYLIFITLRWLIASILLFFITQFFFPEKLFIIQKNSENILWKIFLIYPILSAFPQEFIFCTFFFLRYFSILGNYRKLILMSAIIFCFAHIFSVNFVAPILSIFGGYFFAKTYQRTNSLLIVTLEHSLYGNTLFFIGIGWFFWGGSVGS